MIPDPSDEMLVRWLELVMFFCIACFVVAVVFG